MKFCVQIVSIPAHNRLDFEANRTITLHENSKKLKKSWKKGKSTKTFKINKWPI